MFITLNSYFTITYYNDQYDGVKIEKLEKGFRHTDHIPSSDMKNKFLSGELDATFINRVLDLPQQTIWPMLSQTPEHFILYGGTAVSLRLGHRKSIDFIFFTSKTFLPNDLFREISFLKNGVKI